jgi:predicted flap endonuclease-1-like 5' DNA nuclease
LALSFLRLPETANGISAKVKKENSPTKTNEVDKNTTKRTTNEKVAFRKTKVTMPKRTKSPRTVSDQWLTKTSAHLDQDEH